MVVSLDRWKGKNAVVTGASSGIGAAIAEKLVEEGINVVGLARRKERLEGLSIKLNSKPGQFHKLQCDVTKEQDILSAFSWISANIGPVHILINNAGISLPSSLLDGKTEDWKSVLDTNVLGLCVATREAAKSMRENNIDGHVIHINSISGHSVTPLPNYNVYPASKFAVTALTETLRQELTRMESKIKVTSISPGCVATEIFEKFGMPELLEQMKNLEKVLYPEDIADAVVYVLSTPPHVQIHELTIKPVGELI